MPKLLRLNQLQDPRELKLTSMFTKLDNIFDNPDTTWKKKVELVLLLIIKRVTTLIPLNAYTAMMFVITQLSQDGNCVPYASTYLWIAYGCLSCVAIFFAISNRISRRLRIVAGDLKM